MPKGKPNPQKKLDTQLMKISNEQMHHFSKYRKAGSLVANRIFGILTSHSKTKSIAISRCVIGGSIGKRSSLGAAFAPDFDLVVFINNEHPPFKQVLVELEKILEEFCPQYGFIFKSERKPTRHSLQLQIQIRIPASAIANATTSPQCISFDLLPASNLLSPRHGGMIIGTGVREQTQTEFALIRIAQLEYPDKDSSMYSSSLVDRTVSFVKRQGPFVHNMIRLCKLWNKQVDYSDYMYGRSTMIELVAIFAANKEEAEYGVGSRPSISSAFRKFLHLFEDIDTNMCVYFPFQINPNQAKLLEVYEKKIADRPVVLDPVNPYNNLAVGLSEDAMKAFQKAAKNSLDILAENKGTGLTEPELLPGLASLKIQ